MVKNLSALILASMLIFVLISSIASAEAADKDSKNDLLYALGAVPIGGGVLLGFDAAFARDYEQVIVPGEGEDTLYIKAVIKQVPVKYDTIGKMFLKVPEKIVKEEPLPLPEPEPEPEPPKKSPYPKFDKIQDPDTRIYYPVPGDDPDTPDDESEISLKDIIDLNNDGVIDASEITHFNEYVSTTYNIPLDDYDGDGLINALEISLGTNMNKADSDSDGIADDMELALGFSPTNYDEITQSFDASPYVEGDDIFVNEQGVVTSLPIFVPGTEVIVKVYDSTGTALEEEFKIKSDSTGRIRIATGAKPSAIITIEGQIQQG